MPVPIEELKLVPHQTMFARVTCRPVAVPGGTGPSE
jgi:hypothetical protein